MGNTRWTTADEEAFLRKNVNGYEGAQAVTRTKNEGSPVTKWLGEFFLKWFLKFPDYSNGKIDVSGDVVKKRIRHWFNNHTGARARTNVRRPRAAKIHTSGKPPRDPFATILLGTDRPKQKLQPKQAFAAMRADTSMKSDIEAEWAIELVAHPELKDVQGAFLTFYTRRVGELYDATSAEEKAQVEAYREEEHKKSVGSCALPSLLYPHEESLSPADKSILIQIRTAQRALENMKYACEGFASTVHRLTNSNIAIWVSGPEPANHGALVTTSVCAGNRLSDDKDMYDAYPELTALFEKNMKAHAKACIAPETIQAIMLAYPSSTADARPGIERVSLTADSDDTAHTPPPINVDDPLQVDNPVDGDSNPVPGTPPPSTANRRRVRFKDPKLNEDDSEQSDNAQWPSSDEEEKMSKDPESLRNRFRHKNRDPFMPNPSSLDSPSLRIIARKGGSDDTGRVQLYGGKWLSNYEYEVLIRRTKNKMLVEQLNIPAAVRAAMGMPRVRPPPPPSQQRARIRPQPRVQPERASKSQAPSYVIPGPDNLDTPTGWVDLDDDGLDLTPFDDNSIQDVGASVNSSPILGPGFRLASVAPLSLSAELPRASELPESADSQHSGPTQPATTPSSAVAPINTDEGGQVLAPSPSLSTASIGAPPGLERPNAARANTPQVGQPADGSPSPLITVDGQASSAPHSPVSSAREGDTCPSAPPPLIAAPTPVDERQASPGSDITSPTQGRTAVPLDKADVDLANSPSHASHVAPATEGDTSPLALRSPASPSNAAPTTVGGHQASSGSDTTPSTQLAQSQGHTVVPAGDHDSNSIDDAPLPTGASAAPSFAIDTTIPASTQVDNGTQESALSPRERAKQQTKSSSPSKNSPLKDHGTAVQLASPLTDITMATTSIQLRASNRSKVNFKDVDPLTVPEAVETFFVYFSGVFSGKEESELVLDWLAFECENEGTKTTKLAAALRPKALSAWLRSKSQPMDAPTFEVEVLAKELRNWWISLMPDWRLSEKLADTADTWPLHRRIPSTPADDWRKVKKVGAQGIALVLYALALWRSACVPGDTLHREYVSVREDVAWVMEELVKDLVPFAQRERAARTVEVTTQLTAPDPKGIDKPLRTSSGRESRPTTKRKLDLEDSRKSKRGRRA